jgi:dipeptidase E
MKLYLSSIRIPVPKELAKLLNKSSLKDVSVALITNAKDKYSERPRKFFVDDLIAYMQRLGLRVNEIDLRKYDDPKELKDALKEYDLIWAMGGNTFMLRYEMRRSGFDQAIGELLDRGIVYAGDSAGALVAGPSIAGIESADEPAFAEEVIKDGMNLVPFVVMPHVDNPEFAAVMPVVEKLHDKMIMLKDSQAVVFDGDEHRIVGAK